MPRSRFQTTRVRRKDYSKKRFENGHRERKGVPWKRRAVPLLALGVAAGWMWFLGWSDTFRIEDIEVRGNDRVPAWEIEDAVEELMSERRWLVVPKRSLLFLPEEELRERLTDRFVLASVEISKEPPSSLTVSVEERVSTVFLVMPDGGQAILDLEGVVVRKFLPREAVDVTRRYGPRPPGDDARDPLEGLSVLFSDKNEAFEPRDRTVAPEVVQAVIAAPDLAKTHLGGLAVTSLRVDGFGTSTLRAVTEEGWSVYLDAEQPLDRQLAHARAVLDHSVGPDRPRLDYIDVRFGEKIFYKLR